MKKNDKIVAVVGVVILILASLGIYFWVPSSNEEVVIEANDLFNISSEFQKEPSAILISDNNPYYALIATPLAVHYDKNATQFLAPLYIEKPGDASDTVERLEEQIDIKPINEFSNLSAKEFSIYIAEKYWKKSDAVIIIQDNETGYNLGVVATPISSYLSIPIIVTDKMDNNVRDVLNNLGVSKTIICGDLESHYQTMRFENVDDIINVTIDLIWQRFEHNVEYVTLANPRDASIPEVLEKKVLLSERGALSSGNIFPSHLLKMIKTQYLGGKVEYTFTIPEDYKYALVKLDLLNLEDPKMIEEFGDNIVVGGSLTSYIRTYASPSIKNINGDIEHDRLHFETTLYDSGGKEFNIVLTSAYTILDSADYEITVTAEKIENPYYPMMKNFSSIAPYLTAYHQGIIFAKPDFAFAPTDKVTLNGKTLPGNTQAFYNPILIPVINQYVYENIHKPLNNVLAKIKNVDISENLETLQNDCYNDPFYIALVGDTIMLPQYYYRSPHSDPYTKPTSGLYGTNCPSDFIYGNIDPETYSLLPYNTDYLENDMYTEFPIAENIVGRIVGWDVQDASALITRTIFYDKVINGLGEWKDNSVILVGAGTEMQKLPILTFIRTLMGKTEPMKFPSGEKKFLVERILSNFEVGGFNGQSAEKARAQRVGYTTEALLKIKKDGLLNRLFFPFLLVKMTQGFENVNDLFKLKWYVETALGDQSDIVVGGQLEENSNLIISDSHAIWFEKEHGDIAMDALGGPILLYQLLGRILEIPGYRTPLDMLGAYNVRAVSDMKMGPSVMLIEGCGSGKIDGIHPQNSLAISYLHAGVNAYISPTTFSAFYGALEPRPNFNGGVGFGIVGYLKAAINARKGVYPDVYFNQYIFEHMVLEMANKDIPIGEALRNAKNEYLSEQINITFRWTPPLSIISNLPEDVQNQIDNSIKTTSEDMTFPVEKYCTIYQINLLGDPAFNPYEPCNEG